MTPENTCPTCRQRINPNSDVCPFCGQEFCPDCYYPLPAMAAACPQCGAEFEMYCPQCEATLSADDLVCPNCGLAFTEVLAATTIEISQLGGVAIPVPADAPPCTAPPAANR